MRACVRTHAHTHKQITAFEHTTFDHWKCWNKSVSLSTFLFDVCITEFLFNYKIYIHTQLNGHPLVSRSLPLYLLLFEQFVHTILCGYHRCQHNNNFTIIFFLPLFLFCLFVFLFFGVLVASIQSWWWCCCFFICLCFVNECYWQFIVIAHIIACIRCEHWKWNVFVLLLLILLPFLLMWMSVCMRRRTDIWTKIQKLNWIRIMFALHLKFNKQWVYTLLSTQFALLLRSIFFLLFTFFSSFLFDIVLYCYRYAIGHRQTPK